MYHVTFILHVVEQLHFFSGDVEIYSCSEETMVLCSRFETSYTWPTFHRYPRRLQCLWEVVIVTSGLVVAATQPVLQLKSPNEHPTNQTVPGADLMWIRPNSERQECLRGLCRQVYDRLSTQLLWSRFVNTRQTR